ncbi:MAG: hypothetical protein JRH20_28950, partial [Deltaproteobacteria bacterium]|nr:hypothetical protein [Deltaproteobacteria bacterium]
MRKRQLLPLVMLTALLGACDDTAGYAVESDSAKNDSRSNLLFNDASLGDAEVTYDTHDKSVSSDTRGDAFGLRDGDSDAALDVAPHDLPHDLTYDRPLDLPT